MRKDWVLDSNVSNEKSLVKRLLISRGIKSEEEIEEFLNPLGMQLTSPNAFTDMEKTVERHPLRHNIGSAFFHVSSVQEFRACYS